MTVEQLKQDYPETYNSIFMSGVNFEQSRISACMQNIDEDVQKVSAGIKSESYPNPVNRELEELNASIDKMLK